VEPIEWVPYIYFKKVNYVWCFLHHPIVTMRLKKSLMYKITIPNHLYVRYNITKLSHLYVR